MRWMNVYDEVSANGANYGPKTSESQSGYRVAKKVLNTWYYVSMTYKVIECIEITQNTQILKITDFPI